MAMNCMILFSVVLLLTCSHSGFAQTITGPLSTATATETMKIAPSEPITGGEFGRSIAIDRDVVVVGAAGPSVESGYRPGPGKAYVFRRTGGVYVLETTLTAFDPVDGAEFGRAVTVEGDTIVVGARFAMTLGVERAGAAYIFKRVGGEWVFETKVTSDNPAPDDNFGRAVDLSGNRLVVTARKEEVGAQTDAGAAYVFERKGGAWKQVARLTAQDVTPEARFGQSVAQKGNIILIGARDANSPVATGCGAVYVFAYSGKEWEEVAKITADDGTTGDQFAFNLAFGGNTVVAGARRANLNGKTAAGAAYVFVLTGSGWVQTQKLTASDASQNAEFGHSVAMTGDLIAVGARRTTIGSQTRQGKIYLFRTAADEWVERDQLVASDGKKNDELGHSLSAHGDVVAAGTNGADISGFNDAGAGYLFTAGD